MVRSGEAGVLAAELRRRVLTTAGCARLVTGQLVPDGDGPLNHASASASMPLTVRCMLACTSLRRRRRIRASLLGLASIAAAMPEEPGPIV